VSPGGAEIRVARAGDENGIIEGLNRCRSRPLSLEEWSWSYPPSATGRPIVVAVKDGRIVAHVGGVISAFQIDRRTVPALRVADEFALAEVGGNGEQNRLLAEMLKAWVSEFGGADRIRMIYQLVGEGESSGSPAFTKGRRVALPPVEILARRVAVRSPVRRLAFRAEPARDWEPRLDNLWRRIARSYPFAAVRDAEMSLDRHAGHPGTRRHRFLVFPRFSRHAVAWAVFETDASRCRWVDLVWDHDEPGALDLLAHLSRRLASQVGAMNERIVLGGDAAARARLEALGFRSEGVLEDLSLTVFSLPQMLRPADLDSRFYATQTDLDPLRRIG
jgi:hypothetical protein